MTSAEAPQGPQADAGRYDVFISYSRKDVEFVARLERALETYKAPKSLPLERRRLRVFRDAQDLTGPEYGASIRENLRRSARLLVVCSPHARQSAYVDQEIEWFLETHDSSDVISVLLDGVPNNEADAADPRRAFPAQLTKALAIPLAADFRGFDAARNKPAKPPFDGAWYTLLANVYGIDRNTVEQRDRLRQRRERRIATAIAGAVMASLAVAAVFSWVQMRRAEEQRDVALRGFARYLAMQSDDARPVQPETALLLAVEAARTTRDVDGTLTDEAALALRRALADAGGMRLGTGTRGLSFSPEGDWLARIEDDGTVTAWDLRAPEPKAASVQLPDTELTSLQFGPASQLAVVAKDRNRVALLDVQDLGRPPRWVDARAGPIRSLEFSPDGTALMVLDQGPDITLVDLADPAASPTVMQGHTPRRLGGDAMGLKAAAFSATGRWIASAGWDDTVLLWDRTAGGAAPLRLLTGVSGDAPRFSADDRWLLVGTSRPGEPRSEPFALWNLGASTPETVAMERGDVPVDAIAAPAAFMAADRLVTGGRSETFVWTLSPTGARIERRLPGTLAALGGDGRHFATLDVRSGAQPIHVISLWDAESPEAEAEVEVTSPIHEVGYAAPGHRLVALTEAGELWSWHLEDRDFEPPPRRYPGATGNKLQVSPDGRAAIVGNWYGDARLWNLGNPSLDPVRLDDVDERAELDMQMRSGSSASSMGGRPYGGLQQMLSFDDQARYAAFPLDRGAVDIVDLQHPNRTPVTIPVHEDGVSAVAFSPDGKTVAAGDKALTIRLWHTGQSGEPFATLRVPSDEGADSSISALAFSHSGERLAAGGAFGTVAVWDLSKPGAEPVTLANHEGWVTTVAFSADDRHLLVAADDGKASVVTLADPSSVRMLEGHTGAIRAAFTAGDRSVVTAGQDATIRVWSMNDPEAEPRILRGHSGPIVTFALVPGEQRLVTASEDGSLRVWNLLDAERPEKLIPLRAPLNVLAVSHDGRWLATGGVGGGVELLRMDGLDQAPVELPMAAPRREDDSEVFALRFSPDDRWLAALTPGQGRLWRLRPDELIQLACDASGRNLEVGEWESFLTDLPYRFTCPAWGLGPGYLEVARREAERGSFNHAVRLLSRAKQLVPDLPFDAVPEATRITVAGVLDRGRLLARREQTDAALAEFGRIRQLDPDSSFDPARELERVKRAGELVDQAASQALAGELDQAIATYREALELDPDPSIDPVKDANKIYAPVLVKEGRALAAEGKMEEAVARLERAVSLDPKAIWGTPESEARSSRAEALRNQADKLADAGELQAAIDGYRAALAVNDQLRIDPEAEARKRVAAHWMDEAFSGTDLPASIDLFEKARALDPAVAVPSYRANELCWSAVKRGYAKRAMGVCNAAVAGDAKSWMARDSRGVARLLAGDATGAIQDFEYYVEFSERSDSVEQRKRWIARVKAGWRPQSFAELNEP